MMFKKLIKEKPMEFHLKRQLVVWKTLNFRIFITVVSYIHYNTNLGLTLYFLLLLYKP